MRLLILGGTQFLGRAVAVQASGMGYDVTCAARGVAGPFPPEARFIHVDRDEPEGLAPLIGKQFDAVVDVSRHPGQVRRAVAALKRQVGHWTFVSTTSVYADTVTRWQRADQSSLLKPTAPDVERCTDETYGAAKVACEQATGTKAFICRPGLIVGPGDPTGRFSYWVTRLKRGGDVLVPAKPEDPVQIIDVRDLAQWILHAARTQITGHFDAVGPPCTRLSFLSQGADAVASNCKFTWVDQDFMNRQDIRSETGPRSLPLPIPDTIGDNTRDISCALQAGLKLRDLSETVLDTLRWINTADGFVTGLTADEETIALSAWHAGRY